jgi:hypothetical protein
MGLGRVQTIETWDWQECKLVFQAFLEEKRKAKSRDIKELGLFKEQEVGSKVVGVTKKSTLKHSWTGGYRSVV